VVREMFDDAVRLRETSKKVGRMKLRTTPGESRYAVAVRDGDDLWLALWVRRSPKGEFFIFLPRADSEWNPHASLHADGMFHQKTHDEKFLPQQRQRPDSIRGAEHLGASGGYGPKTVGAICDPRDFNGVFEAPPGILGPRNGQVVVDLLENERAEPLMWP